MTTTELLPLGQSIPPSVLKKDFVKLEDKPYGQPALGYSVVLPNDWIQLKLKAADARLHVERPKLLATFLGPKDDGGNPMLQVWCQGLIKEISAGDWLKDFLSRTGCEIISLEIRSTYLADALVTRRDGPVLLKIRFSARLAGNRLFLCEGVAPEDLFPNYADRFGLAATSFKPTLITDNPHVEVWQTHSLDNAVSFNAPFSWFERHPQAPAGIDLLDLYNLNGAAEPVGNLKVMAIRRALTKGKKDIDLPALLTAEFLKIGVRIAELVSSESIEAPEPLSNGSLKICKAVIPNAPHVRLQNLLVLSVDAPTHHILVGLLTCAPCEGFYEYAVNRRAFDIVLETLKLQVPSPAKTGASPAAKTGR